MKKIFHITLLLSVGINLYSQLLPDSEYNINVKPYHSHKISGYAQEHLSKSYQIRDSLSAYFQLICSDSLSNESNILKYTGLGIVINIREQKDSAIFIGKDARILKIISNIPPYPTYYYNINNLEADSINKIAKMLRNREFENTSLTNAYQTCISYAFENIFKYNGIEPYPIFSYKTIVDNKNISSICNLLLKKIDTIDKKKVDKYKIPEKSFILFKDANGESIHACFYMDNKIWSKNGMFPYSSNNKLSDFLKYSYKNTVTLDIYLFNHDIFTKDKEY